MDRIARDGVAFRQAYAAQPSSLRPARSSWPTGRTPLEHGVLINAAPIDPQMPDLGQWLRKHGGYHTAYSGKWHIPARDVRESFDLLHPRLGMGEIGDGDVSGRSRLPAQPDQRRAVLPLCRIPQPARLLLHLRRQRRGGASSASRPKSRASCRPCRRTSIRSCHGFPASKRKRVGGWSELDWRYYIYSCYRQTEMADAHVGLVYTLSRALTLRGQHAVCLCLRPRRGNGPPRARAQELPGRRVRRVPTIGEARRPSGPTKAV
ncbi:MAG: sulfatase-like hydrolase/transferase [Bryobacterales bacterium]